jgi:hypothetical protein
LKNALTQNVVPKCRDYTKEIVGVLSHVPGYALIAGSSKKTIRDMESYQTFPDLPKE